MSPQTNSALLSQRLQTPAESPDQRRARETRSVQVARQMLSNGCSANAVTRYTGLKEEQLRALEVAGRRAEKG